MDLTDIVIAKSASQKDLEKQKGVAGGIATLDTSGKIPEGQLPSYVDEVKEYDSFDKFPATGESGKIYVAIDTGRTYRWSGTQYVQIGGTDQIQVDWEQTDTSKIDYIKNKPTIPEVIVDSAISKTSANPVQNKVIEAYLEPILGEVQDPSNPTINMNGTFPQHEDTDYIKTYTFTAVSSTDVPYYGEIVVNYDSTANYSKVQGDIKIGFTPNGTGYVVSCDSVSSEFYVSQIDTYIYNQSGTLVGHATQGSSGPGRRRFIAGYTNPAIIPPNPGTFTTSSCKILHGVNVEIINEQVFTCFGYWDTLTIEDNYNWTFNGDTRSPYQKLVDKVATLETSKQDILISGENIKTLNNESLLGSGNIEIEQAQADWNQTDSTADDFIKNKPFDVVTGGTTTNTYNLEGSGYSASQQFENITLSLGQSISISVAGNTYSGVVTDYTEQYGGVICYGYFPVNEPSEEGPGKLTAAYYIPLQEQEGEEIGGFTTLVYQLDTETVTGTIPFTLTLSTQTITKLSADKINIDGTSVISDNGVLKVGNQITVDSALSTTSENPVQNKVITNKIAEVVGYPVDPSSPVYNYSFIPPKSSSCLANGLFVDDNSNAYYVEFVPATSSSVFTDGSLSYSFSLYNNHIAFYIHNNTSATIGYSTFYGIGPITIYSNSGVKIFDVWNNSAFVDLAANSTFVFECTSYTTSKFINLNNFLWDETFRTGTLSYRMWAALNSSWYSYQANPDTSASAYTNFNYTINGELPLSPFEKLKSRVTNLESGKQDSLTAGDNITIENNVISATNTKYTVTIDI